MKRGLKITMALILVLALLGGCAPETEESEPTSTWDTCYENDTLYTYPEPEPVETWASYEFESKVDTIEPIEGDYKVFNNL